MASCEVTRTKVTNIQINKLKSSGKNKTGTALIMTKINFQDEEMTHEFFKQQDKKLK